MHLRRLALAAILAVLVAACSSAGVSPSVAPATRSPSPPATSPAAATRIEVSLTDALKMEPGSMTVPAGVPVTFVVSNRGAIDHEFYLGDEEAQAEHETEMQSAGGMRHDEPEGIAVKPGETKELTYTFTRAGQVFAGCHVAGHYAAGMKAAITVSG